MKLFDKILVSAAGLSVYGIAMIVFSGELSSEYFRETPKDAKKSGSLVSSLQKDFPESEPAIKKNKDLVIYDKEVDEIIEAYFKNIRQNPDKMEEEDRLINDNEGTTRSGEKVSGQASDQTRAGEREIRYRKHVVTSGDSLWRISQKFNVPVYTIISANPEKEKEMIRPGDILNIPNHSGIIYKVKNGDSLSAIAKKYKIATSEIIELNQLGNSIIKNGQTLFLPEAKPLVEFKIVTKNRFLWPLYGKITSGYGMRKHPMNNSMQFHTGIDIGANVGAPIHSTADGVVVYSGDGGTYGNMVILRHKEGYMSIYAHASSLLVKKDQYVKRGQLIARVGATGVVTGPHLHFEVKKFNTGMNPISALNEKIKTKVAQNL